MPRFAAFTTTGLRNASGSTRLPWHGRAVTLICVGADGLVTQAKTVAEKRALLDRATRKDLVLVAWPGQWSQDIYVVDDRKAARAALAAAPGPRRLVIPGLNPSGALAWRGSGSPGRGPRWSPVVEPVCGGPRVLVGRAVSGPAGRDRIVAGGGPGLGGRR
jgi:hypothetical protein